MKDKKGKTVLNTFIKIVNKLYCTPNKLWVDQGKVFFNTFVLKWLNSNDIVMYSTHNEGKAVIAEMLSKQTKLKSVKNDS